MKAPSKKPNQTVKAQQKKTTEANMTKKDTITITNKSEYLTITGLELINN